MKNKQKGFISIIVIVVVILIATTGYVYVKKQKPVAQDSVMTAPVVQEVELQKTSSSTNVTFTEHIEKDSPDFSYKADVKSTVDCGSQDCFNKKFSSCEPATLKAEIDGMGAVSYKIIGKSASGCNLTFKYTKYPDPTWENKEMTCPFNNTVSFETSMQKVFEGVPTGEVVCTGPLYKILHP